MPVHDDLMAAARTQTGLGDFGDDSFREGLEILASAIYPRLRRLPDPFTPRSGG